MADSSVDITAGSGTSVDTRTEATNGHHRQVVVLGDPSTNAGVAPVDATNGLSVTLTTALPAGTNAFGKLAANSGVDIGDVTINNASGASAVNIQDGGNAITVDAVPGSFFTDVETIAGSVPSILSDADGSVGGNQLGVRANMRTYNGTTWDRARGASDGLDSTGTGIQAVVATAQYDASSAAITDNRFGNLRMSSNRNLFVSLRDGAGNERAANIDYQGRMPVMPTSEGVTVSGNVLLESQRQPVNVSSNGQILVSGVANRKIRVLNGVLMAAAATTINLKNNNNTDVTGPLPLASSGGFQIPHAPLGDFETAVGANLTIAMSSAQQVGGWLTYVLV